MDQPVNLTISKEIVAPIVQARIEAAVAEAFTDPKDLIAKMVGCVLDRKVDHEGKHDKYDGYNKYTFIEWLCEDAIRQAANKAVRKWLAENSAKVEATLLRELNKRNKNFAKLIIDGMEKSLESTWTMKVDVNFNKTRDF